MQIYVINGQPIELNLAGHDELTVRFFFCWYEIKMLYDFT